MRKGTIVLVSLITSLSLSAQITVKDLSLKFVLYESAYELYTLNVVKPLYLRASLTMNCRDSRQYKHFLIKTYHSLPDERKEQLRTIFTRHGSWYHMNQAACIPDSAGIEEIMNNSLPPDKFDSLSIRDAKRFLPFYYENFLKSYIAGISGPIHAKILSIQSNPAYTSLDIISFMEKESGVSFSKRYKPEFYYTLSFTQACGFNCNDRKISTLPRNTKPKQIISTPFHEYSHEFFQTFTRTEEFTVLADSMKSDKKIMRVYEMVGKYAYDWTGWIEENLVSGFSLYLEYRLHHSYTADYTPFDKEFCKFLISEKFNPQKETLRDISFRFLREKLAKH